jgi:hypothetical protein
VPARMNRKIPSNPIIVDFIVDTSFDKGL